MSEIAEVLAGGILPDFGAARDTALASEVMRQGTALPHPSAADIRLPMDRMKRPVSLQVLHNGFMMVLFSKDV